MYLLEDIELFNKQSSNPGTGVEGLVLLNNGFYYSVTVFDTFTDWKEIEVLEDQYTNEQIEAIENELLSMHKKKLYTPEKKLYIPGKKMKMPEPLPLTAAVKSREIRSAQMHKHRF